MIEAEQIDISTLSQEQILQAAYNYCATHGYALACWSQPGDNTIQFIVDRSGNLDVPEQSLEELNGGFLFSPFDKEEPSIFIKANTHIRLNTKEVLKDDTEVMQELLDHVEEHEYESSTNNTEDPTGALSGNSAAFEELVTKSIDKIKNSEVEKIVPSRFKQITLNTGFSPALNFLKLQKTYPESFVSIVFTPETNTWLGATPELLLKTEGPIFKTIALAATQNFDPDKHIADIAWTQKEIEEQALVSRYIINCFKKIRLREFDEHGPKTVQAGNLIHLKTEFKADMEATGFPKLGSIMLDLLHPTSAICGMPLQPSLAFLKDNEGYDRKFFSGYLGPVNITEASASIYVNLRCMEIEGATATLYAGAGVTEDSSPHKEWLETEMKMNTLLNVIS